MKFYIVYLALCSLTHAVYISRMSSVNRLRAPTPFRPGLNLQRPWGHTRLVQAASHRAPYVLYRKAPQRFAVKHLAPSATRNMFASGPWKTTGRLPPLAPVTPEYEFVKAASSAPVVHTDGGTGAIHTIPAPNLSLSEKPIVVIETSDNPVSEQPRPTYEVTEKYPEPEYSVAKIESPIGFSKTQSFTTPELQTLIRNGAALQLAAEYSLPAISINQHQALQHKAVQHQYPLQSALPTQQDLINTGADGLFIPPNALYQQDPMFLQKLQTQLLQRFPSVEFIPYAAETPSQTHIQPEASQIHAQVVHPQMFHPQVVHTQVIHQQELQPQMILLENEQLDAPSVPQRNEPKTVVQREVQESSVVTLVPQAFVAPNTTVKQVAETPPSVPENITVELVATETQPPTTTVKYVIESNSEQNTTPIYYAQIGQSVGSVIANGFYSALNEVRAAAALAQEEQSPVYKAPENVTSTTNSPDLQQYFVQNDEKTENKTELKPLLGVPFSKSTDSVNVAYTLVRADDNPTKVNKEGAVYAGQIVEATITEDHDFNKEKASMISRRAPIRLFAVNTDAKNIASSANTLPKVTVVKAKIPPKSKLTFDDKTGEPILRIYASYVDNPNLKDAVVSKLSSLKQVKDAVTRKETVDNWKSSTVKSVDKTQGFDTNQVTQFGLKLRERNDYYEPFFEDYEDL
nr:uncharacterized protein LOC110383932 [Helicoverpa armigera]